MLKIWVRRRSEDSLSTGDASSESLCLQRTICCAKIQNGEVKNASSLLNVAREGFGGNTVDRKVALVSTECNASSTGSVFTTQWYVFCSGRKLTRSYNDPRIRRTALLLSLHCCLAKRELQLVELDLFFPIVHPANLNRVASNLPSPSLGATFLRR